MTRIETEIDCIRVAAACPERTIILRPKRGAECYLPVWVSPSQAGILAASLQGQPDGSTACDLFLASINAADTDIKGVTVHLENNAFCAKMLLSREDRPSEVECPIGIALALASRVEAPILVDEALFGKAGVTFPL